MIFAVLAAAYIRLSFGVPKNSDDASVVQRAQDVLRGNIILRGWTLGPDNFFTLLLPLYAVAGLFVPRLSLLMYVVNPLVYAFMVSACLAIGWKYTEPCHRLIGMSLLFAVVALPSTLLAENLLHEVHVPAVLCALLTFYLIVADYSLALAALPLILADIGYPFALYVGNLPVALVGIWLGLKAGQRRYFRFVVLAVSCALVSKGALAGLQLLGGFKTQPLITRFVSMDQLPHNFYLFCESILNLFGADFFGRDVFNLGTGVILIHAAVIVLVIWAVCEAGVRVIKGEESLMIALLWASLAFNLMAFVFSTSPLDAGTARYLVTVPVFGALIAAMSWQKLGGEKYAVYVLPVVACAYVGAFAVQVFRPIAKPPVNVIRFLEENGLREGYGSYWSASILSVISDGKIAVRQVAAGREGMVPLRWLSSEDWYAMKDARFLIFKDTAFGVNLHTAIRSWGSPMRVEQIDGYTVAVWDSAIGVPLHGDFPP